MIPLARPRLPKAAAKDIAAILDSGMLVEGARTKAFSEALAKYTGAPHAVLVNSGTSALYLALKALGIGPGDSVIVPAYTFPATANAVLWAGAVPVLADVNPLTWNLDAATVEARLAEMKPAAAARIQAVMPVQCFGNPVDIRPLLRLAKRRGWKVIEDAACALGSTLDGEACGTHGDAGCFSFHPRKVLTTGEGGAVLVRSAALARKLALLKNHGMERKGAGMVFLEPGLNLRFTEVAAALGLRQLEAFDRHLDRRHALADLYVAGLRRLGLTVQETIPGGRTNWQSLVARLPLKTPAQLDRLVAAMAELGFGTVGGTYFLGSPAVLKGRLGVSATLPVAAELRHQALAMPFHEDLGERGVARVLKALEATLGEVAGRGRRR